jgi:recombinational DNA repair protein RecT
MDRDTQMLQEMGNAVIALQMKFRNSPLADRMAIKPALEELLSDYANYQIRLLKEGIITSEQDLAEMADIRQEIEQAAEKEALLKAIGKTIAFVAVKI